MRLSANFCTIDISYSLKNVLLNKTNKADRGELGMNENPFDINTHSSYNNATMCKSQNNNLCRLLRDVQEESQLGSLRCSLGC